MTKNDVKNAYLNGKKIVFYMEDDYDTQLTYMNGKVYMSNIGFTNIEVEDEFEFLIKRDWEIREDENSIDCFAI